MIVDVPNTMKWHRLCYKSVSHLTTIIARRLTGIAASGFPMHATSSWPNSALHPLKEAIHVAERDQMTSLGRKAGLSSVDNGDIVCGELQIL